MSGSWAIAVLLAGAWVASACAPDQRATVVVDVDDQAALELVLAGSIPDLPIEDQLVLNDAIAHCMAESGFSYWGPDLVEEVGRVELTLAVSTAYFHEDFVDPPLEGSPRGLDMSVVEDVGRDAVYYRSLPPSARTAYLEVLEGEDGCEVQALDQLGFSIYNRSSDGGGDAGPPVDLGAVTGLANHEESVVACLRAEGSDFDSFQSARAYFHEQVTQIAEEQVENVSPDMALTAEGIELLADLQAYERQVEADLAVCEAFPEQLPPEILASLRDAIVEPG